MIWQVLTTVLDLTYDSLNSESVRWCLIGSTATSLQGCSITPNDIDILTATPQGVHHFVHLLDRFTPHTCPFDEEDEERWHSSKAYPVQSGLDPYGYMWHFARWFIQGIKTEIAHIVPPDSFRFADAERGIWEGGPEIWRYIATVPFGEFQVPVVPLIIQLETNLSRNLTDRVQEIIHRLNQTGVNPELLQLCLSRDHVAAVKSKLKIIPAVNI